MDRINDYVLIMIDSLKKKSAILDSLLKKNQEQLECIQCCEFDNINWDQFNIIVSEKEAEIDRINEMDEGFQALYDRVGRQLKDSKEEYAKQIKEMQALIKELEEKSVSIRIGESRNRDIIEKIMNSRKKDIKNARTSLKVASSYYTSMQKALEVNSNLVDKKK